MGHPYIMVIITTTIIFILIRGNLGQNQTQKNNCHAQEAEFNCFFCNSNCFSFSEHNHFGRRAGHKKHYISIASIAQNQLQILGHQLSSHSFNIISINNISSMIPVKNTATKISLALQCAFYRAILRSGSLDWSIASSLAISSS